MTARLKATVCSVIAMVVTGCGAPIASASAPPAAASNTATSPRAPTEISREEALDLARDALRKTGVDWRVVRAQAGGLAPLMPEWETTEWGAALAGDLRVWHLALASGELSAAARPRRDGRNGLRHRRRDRGRPLDSPSAAGTPSPLCPRPVLPVGVRLLRLRHGRRAGARHRPLHRCAPRGAGACARRRASCGRSTSAAEHRR